MGLGKDNAVELNFLTFAVICLVVVVCCWVFGERRGFTPFPPPFFFSPLFLPPPLLKWSELV